MKFWLFIMLSWRWSVGFVECAVVVVGNESIIAMCANGCVGA